MVPEPEMAKISLSTSSDFAFNVHATYTARYGLFGSVSETSVTDNSIVSDPCRSLLSRTCHPYPELRRSGADPWPTLIVLEFAQRLA